MSTKLALATISLQTLGSLAYYLAFGISFLESIAFVGLIIPSTTLLIALGFLVSLDVLRGETLFLVVALGGFLGDVVSFFLGTHGMQWFKPGNKIFKVEYLRKGESFFTRHGAKSVFFARFISPLRPMMPFVAGLFGMPRGRFLVYAATGSAASAAVFLGLGYAIGVLSDHSLGFLSHLERIGIGTFAIIIGILLFRRFLIRSGEALFKAVQIFFRSVLGRLAATRGCQTLLVHHRRAALWLRAEPHRVGVVCIVVGVLMMFPFGLFLPWLSTYLESFRIQAVDFSILRQFFFWRTESLTVLVRAFTNLGSPYGIALMSLLIMLRLGLSQRLRTLAVYSATVIGTSGVVALLKHLVDRPRPAELLAVYQESSTSFPSFHAALTLVVLFFLAYLLQKKCRTWAMSVNLWLGVVIITILMGVTRIYLGVHYPTDVLAGYVLGFGCFLIGVGGDKALQARHDLDKAAVIS